MIIHYSGMVDVSYVEENMFTARIEDDKIHRRVAKKPKLLRTSNYKFNAILLIKRK